MLTHDKLLREVGLRQTSDLVSSKVIDVKDIILPRDTTYVYLGRDNDFNPSELIKTTARVKMFTVDEYNGHTFGKFRKTSFRTINYNKKIAHDFKNIEPVLQATRLTAVPPATPLLINYGALDQIYKYPIQRETDYNMVMNKIETMVHTLHNFGLDKRKKYIEIRVPSLISPRINYEKAINDTKPSKLIKHLKYKEEYIIFELYKYLDKDKHEESLFSTFDDHQTKNTVLVFVLNNKVSLIPLSYLRGMVKELNKKDKVQQLPSMIIKKAFILFIINMIKASPVPIKELEETVTDVSELTEDVLDSNIDNNIEDMLKLDEELDTLTNIDTETTFTSVTKADIVKGKEDNDKAIELIETLSEIGNVSEQVKDKQIALLTNKKVKQAKTVSTIKQRTLKRSITVANEDDLKDTVGDFDRTYIEEFMESDKEAVIDSLTLSGNVVTDHKVIDKTTPLSAIEEHIITFSTLAGRSRDIKILLPKVEKDGTFYLRGNRYTMRKQKLDAPIRKIASDNVALTSYYSKLFIKKRDTNVNNMYYKIYKQISKMNETKTHIKRVVAGTNKYIDLKLPVEYTGLGSFIKTITVDKIFITFNYRNRHSLTDKDVEKLEGKEYILIGKDRDDLLYFINKDADVFIYEKSMKPLNKTLFEFLYVDTSDILPDVSTVQINRTRIPLVVILIYILGFDNLLKVMNTTFRIDDKSSRPDADEFKVRIGSSYFFFKKTERESALLFSGLKRIEKTLKEVDHTSLNIRAGVESLFTLLGYNRRLRVDIGLLNNLWMDPITKSVLKEMGEPVTFSGLLIRANELLADDYAKHPNDVSEVFIKGYERINGILYKEMTTMLKDYAHKRGMVRTTLAIQPYAVINSIMNDSTTTIVDDLNPIMSLKQKEDVTYTGMFGRNKDTITQASREFHPSEVGLISEATKDSGEVGATVYLSANPDLGTVRGKKAETKKITKAKVISTSAMLAPFSTLDDSKRLGFVSVQNQHVVAIEHAQPPAVRTGYETIFAQRVSDRFVITAKEDGEVLSVSDKYLTVKYKSGKDKIALRIWTTKEEAGAVYKHHIITDLLTKSKFKQGDVLAYDKTFFTRDIFDKTMVVMKNSVLARTIMLDEEDTIEDAAKMSESFSKRMKMSSTKVRDIKLTVEDNVTNFIEIGTKVEYNTPLFTMTGNVDTSNLSKQEKEALQELVNKNPKAKTTGKITNIEVFYNCEFKELPKGIKKLVEESDKRLIDKTGFPGKVSSEYSVKGKPLKEGNFIIKFFIDKSYGMQPGDKGILANQLKFTVSNLLEDSTRTEDGNKIDLEFSITAAEARIVNSYDMIGTLSSVVDKVREDVLEMYYG